MMKLKKYIKNVPSQPGFTCQTKNPGHETEITLQKKIKTNYKIEFSINLMLKFKK